MSGFVADTTSYKPWMQNVTPTFTPSFNVDSLGTFSPSIHGWGTTIGSASNSSDTSETLEEFQRKEAKKGKEKLQETTQNTAKQKEIEIQKKELASAKEQLEKGKQADGTAVVETSLSEYKKLPW